MTTENLPDKSAKVMSETLDIEVEVTEADIFGATPNHFKQNPVARALTRTLGRRASVGHHAFTLQNVRQEFPLPRIVLYRVNCFDRTGKMKPFKFKITVPKSLRLTTAAVEAQRETTNDY